MRRAEPTRSPSAIAIHAGRAMTVRLLLAAVVVGFPCRVIVAQEKDRDETQRIDPPSVPDDSGKRPDLAAVARHAVVRTNEFRKKEGRPPVAVEAKLQTTAKAFSDYMAEHDKYGHKADDRQPHERAKAHGYDYCIVTENIAHAFDSRGFEVDRLAAVFVEGWQQSPGHRRNMLDPDVTQTAVAVARSERTGRYYAVQLFGRPKSAAIEFRVANESGETVRYQLAHQTFDLEPRSLRTHAVCRPPEVTFVWPDENKQTLKPAAGARLVVVKTDAGFAVRTEPAERPKENKAAGCQSMMR
jgi:uncharacterized protein YkwD